MNKIRKSNPGPKHMIQSLLREYKSKPSKNLLMRCIFKNKREKRHSIRSIPIKRNNLKER